MTNNPDAHSEASSANMGQNNQDYIYPSQTSQPYSPQSPHEYIPGPSNPRQSPNKRPDLPKKNNKVFTILIAAIVVVALIVAGLSIWVFVRRGSSDELANKTNITIRNKHNIPNEAAVLASRYNGEAVYSLAINKNEDQLETVILKTKPNSDQTEIELTFSDNLDEAISNPYAILEKEIGPRVIPAPEEETPTCEADEIIGEVNGYIIGVNVASASSSDDEGESPIANEIIGCPVTDKGESWKHTPDRPCIASVTDQGVTCVDVPQIIVDDDKDNQNSEDESDTQNEPESDNDSSDNKTDTLTKDSATEAKKIIDGGSGGYIVEIVPSPPAGVKTPPMQTIKAKSKDAIRDFDFNNATYILNTQGSNVKEKVFKDGVALFDEEARGDMYLGDDHPEFALLNDINPPAAQQFNPLTGPSPVFGDLNGDGYEDALILYTWSSEGIGGNGTAMGVFCVMWDPENNEGVVPDFSDFTTGGPSTGFFTSVAIEDDGTIVLERSETFDRGPVTATYKYDADSDQIIAIDDPAL